MKLSSQPDEDDVDADTVKELRFTMFTLNIRMGGKCYFDHGLVVGVGGHAGWNFQAQQSLDFPPQWWGENRIQ